MAVLVNIVEMTALILAFFLIDRFIKHLNLSQTGGMDKKIILMHLISNGLTVSALCLVMWCLVLLSIPDQSCASMLSHMLITVHSLIIFEVLSFACQCFVYSICYNYVLAANRIANVCNVENRASFESSESTEGSRLTQVSHHPLTAS